MTATQEQMPNDVDGLAPVAASAGPGARLRAAREAAGLSLDQVAQQLKLAPRQVKALEEESFGELPGSLINLLHYAALMFELVDRILQLLIEHNSVGHHYDTIKHSFIVCVVQ